MIHEVGGGLSYAAAAAACTERSALAGRWDQPVEAAVAAAEPRESSGEPAFVLLASPQLALHRAQQDTPAVGGRSRRLRCPPGVESVVRTTIKPAKSSRDSSGEGIDYATWSVQI